MTHHHSSSSALPAFLAGAATAALIGGIYLYGKNGSAHRTNVERWILKAKAEILERIEKTQDMTEEQFHTVVDEVVSRYADMKDVGAERAAEVSSRFKHKWVHLRDAAARASKEARRELNDLQEDV